MKAAVWNEQGGLDIVDRSVPEPGPGWVRLRVAGSGICGSDLHGYKRHSLLPKGTQPGHEVAGWIDLVGDDVDLASGALVGLEPIAACGQCRDCRLGKYTLCRKVALFGFRHPGGMAEYMLAPAERLHALPADLSIPVATLCEPLAVCVRGLRLGQVSVGDRVAILGAGTIGLLCIPLALRAGAREVLVTARHPRQAEFAKALGATAVFQDIDALQDSAGDRCADVVLETVGGASETLVEAMRIADTAARIVMLGVFDGNTPIPGRLFFAKELTLQASNCYCSDRAKGDFQLAAEEIADLGAMLEPLVTHHFALDQIEAAFATAADKATGSIKVQIQY